MKHATENKVHATPSPQPWPQRVVAQRSPHEALAHTPNLRFAPLIPRHLTFPTCDAHRRHVRTLPPIPDFIIMLDPQSRRRPQRRQGGPADRALERARQCAKRRAPYWSIRFEKLIRLPRVHRPGVDSNREDVLTQAPGERPDEEDRGKLRAGVQSERGLRGAGLEGEFGVGDELHGARGNGVEVRGEAEYSWGPWGAGAGGRPRGGG